MRVLLGVRRTREYASPLSSFQSLSPIAKCQSAGFAALQDCITVAVCLCLSGSQPAAQADPVPDAVLQAEQQRIAAVAKAVKAAVAVFANDGQGGGSGVVITPDGYALSNFHVTKPAGDWMQCGMADGQLYDAVIVGLDPTGDVALIKLQGREDFPCAELGDSDAVRVGDWCFAVGNPFLLATDFQPTVTYGLVSGVHRYQYPAGTLAGVRRLHSNRRVDQPRQLRRALVQRRRTADRHQRPRLV